MLSAEVLLQRRAIRSADVSANASRSFFAFSQCSLDLPANSSGRLPLPLQKAKPVPQSDDFAFSFGIHRRESPRHQR